MATNVNTAGAVNPNGRPGAPQPLDKGTIAKEVAPSSFASSSWVNWADAAASLGQPFGGTQVPFTTLSQMRRDPMIAFALNFIKVPLIRAPWYIDCIDAQVAAFVDGALRRIFSRFILQYCNCLDFGYSPMAKRFEQDFPDWTYVDPRNTTGAVQLAWPSTNAAAVVWKPFTALPPQNCKPIWDKNGDFGGFSWTKAAQTQIPGGLGGTSDAGTPGEKPKAATGSQGKTGEEGVVDVFHALWATNEKDSVFGSLYGYPRISYAFRYWWSYWFRWALADRAFERHVDPAIVVWFPDERVQDDVTGDVVNTSGIAAVMGDQARSGATVTFPNTRMESPDGSKLGEREWSIEPLDTKADFAALADTFEHLEVMKLRSCMVPEQALIEGKGGTSSRNVAEEMGDAFEESLSVLMSEIVDQINRYMIPQLVLANFPEKIKQGKGSLSCRMVTRGFAATDMQLTSQLLQLIGQNDPTSLGIDVAEVLKMRGVPLLHPEERARQAGEAQLNQLPPPPDPNAPTPTPASGSGGAGGNGNGNQPTLAQPPGSGQQPQQINPTAGAGLAEARPADINGKIVNGQYVQQPERIHLAATVGSFTKRLKLIHHVDSDEAMDAAATIRDIYEAAYREAYVACAEAVGGSQRVAAAEGDDLEGLDLDERADRLLARAVRKVRAIFERAGRKAKPQVERLMRAVGRRGLASARSDATKYDKAGADVAKYLREREDLVLGSVSDAVAEEVRDFLAAGLTRGLTDEEIAAEMRAHFDAFPAWKANRVARTEAAIAANHAVIYAAKAAGFDKVRAHDASRGTDNSTDADCVNRNGQMFDLDEALRVTVEEHPNGTLGFDLVPS